LENPLTEKVIENVTVTVSPDGKTLTRIAKIQGRDGEFTMKGVYEKQAGDSVGTPKKLTVGVQ